MQPEELGATATVSIDLDPEQLDAATTAALRVRVLAGAGSGKTRTLVARVDHLLRQGVHPAQICVITFTRKAASELGSRLGKPSAMIIGTIHSLGFRILQRERPGRTIASEGTRITLIKQSLAELKLRDLPEFKEVLREIRVWRAFGKPMSPRVQPVGLRLQEKLNERRMWDFDDLINIPNVVLSRHPESKARWQGRWQHILVDECQDTDLRQWHLLNHLVTDDTGLYLVGDLAQSIYRFRGARPEAMLEEVDEWFGPFVDFTVGANYRSRPAVVHLANAVMREQPGAVRLRPERAEHPFVTRVLPRALTPHDEARAIMGELREAHSCGYSYGDMAVLTRTNAQQEPLEAAAYAMGLPVLIVGGMSFYARREVQDVLAYLTLSLRDDGESVRRIYNRPSRYLGKAWLDAVTRAGGWVAWFELRGVVIERPTTWQQRQMNLRSSELWANIMGLRQLIADGGSLSEVVHAILEGDIKYKKWACGEDEGDDADDVVAENLQALEEAVAGWPDVAGFLAFTEVCSQRASGTEVGLERVQLSTVHRAKGLEWAVVAVAGITHGVFPHRLGRPDEERRVFYVALTRAKDRLVLSGHGQASRYWGEVLDAVGLSASEGDQDCEVGAPGDDPGGDASA